MSGSLRLKEQAQHDGEDQDELAGLFSLDVQYPPKSHHQQQGSDRSTADVVHTQQANRRLTAGRSVTGLCEHGDVRSCRCRGRTLLPLSWEGSPPLRQIEVRPRARVQPCRLMTSGSCPLRCDHGPESTRTARCLGTFVMPRQYLGNLPMPVASCSAWTYAITRTMGPSWSLPGAPMTARTRLRPATRHPERSRAPKFPATGSSSPGDPEASTLAADRADEWAPAHLSATVSSRRATCSVAAAASGVSSRVSSASPSTVNGAAPPGHVSTWTSTPARWTQKTWSSSEG